MIDIALARLHYKSAILEEPTSIESAPEKGGTVASARMLEIRGRLRPLQRRSRTEVAAPKLIERIWPDGRREWACRYCGREVRPYDANRE